ncbi:hypothetical protein ACH5RR_025343 [Cinchona calisaya]|uniref:Uncharacterized protein n=1 Tax=Cinchona calisaya TaxID=153742 RepID=A0ABD2YZY8_9GENT
MVPSKDSPNKPCFPECLDWTMENQHQDGSWGLFQRHSLLLKDHLSCTMACVLALTKWRVGEQLVTRGFEFIGSHWSAITKEDLLSPIGLDILFPNMMNEAIKLGLNMPFDQVLVGCMTSNRTSLLERINKGKVSVLVYVAEGLDCANLWEGMKNQQRSNGSFSNSRATTAGVLIRHHDDKCFKYLCSVLEEHKDGDELDKFTDQEQFFDKMSMQFTSLITIQICIEAVESSCWDDDVRGDCISLLKVESKRKEEKKPNSVSLDLLDRRYAGVTEEEVMRAIKAMMENSQRRLLGMVLQAKGSLVPKICKDSFGPQARLPILFTHRGMRLALQRKSFIISKECFMSLSIL